MANLLCMTTDIVIIGLIYEPGHELARAAVWSLFWHCPLIV